MKRLLKLLLSLFILFAGIYAATPLWLPQLLARQLPPGWQLEKLEAAYPGISGININLLRVTGGLQAARLTLSATDIRFSYQGLQTDIGSVSLAVHLHATAERAAVAPTLDDLSLPTTKLTGKLPELSIHHLQVALHLAEIIGPGTIVKPQPLKLEFQAFKLLPGNDNNFHLSTQLSIEAIPGTVNPVSSQLNIDANTNALQANIRFPEDLSSPPWLTITLQQKTRGPDTTTGIMLAFDADTADPQWLDAVVALGTGEELSHLSGKLRLQADFSGEELQSFEHLSLTTEHLLGELQDGTLQLDAELQLDREGEKVTVNLPRPAEIQYQDKTGNINDLLEQIMPGLQRSSQPMATVHAVLDDSSLFVIQAGTVPAMTFTGDVKFSLISDTSTIALQANNIQAELADLSRLDTLTTKSLITLNWMESTAFIYHSDALDLQANKLSLTSTGQLQITPQRVNFGHSGNFELELNKLRTLMQTGTEAEPAPLEFNADHFAVQGQLDFDLSLSELDAPVNFFLDGALSAGHTLINLPGDEHSPPMTIAADEMSLTAKLSSIAGSLLSTGSGTFIQGRSAPPATSVSRVDIAWQELDLLNLAGQLSTETQGFTTEIDGEAWSGFDFDIAYTLQSNADLDGSGILKFDSGTEIPIEFTGNTLAERWNITLPASTIKMTQLADLLRVAQFELPDSVKLSAGSIDFQGMVVVEDEITAKIAVKGYEMAASMLESRADKAGFTFSTHYGNTLSASGPLSIESIELAGGINVAHLSAHLKLENTDSFGLRDLYAELFDGQLNISNLHFVESRIDDTTVELTHISLGQLLAYADIDGLQGSGNLQIFLPIGSDQAGVYIKNGTFNSAGPGLISYTQVGTASSNIGLQALENFHYQDFSGTIDYQTDGAYQITIHLEGKNPDLYGGHPVVFNLNISGSLPELFEAMFMTGSFEESILKQIGAK